MLFGANKDRGLRFDASFRPEIVTGGELGSAYVWDETAENPAPAMALATMNEGEFPVPIGVFQRLSKPSFESGVHAQLMAAAANKKQSLQELLRAGEIWEVS